MQEILKILILEDDMNRVREFTNRFVEFYEETTKCCKVDHVETAQDCIDKLSEKEYDCIFLDHDLGGEVYVDEENTNTGSEVARWLRVNKNQFQKDCPIIIHSLNPAGRANMSSLIEGSHEAPFAWTKEVFSKILR